MHVWRGASVAINALNPCISNISNNNYKTFKPVKNRNQQFV